MSDTLIVTNSDPDPDQTETTETASLAQTVGQLENETEHLSEEVEEATETAEQAQQIAENATDWASEVSRQVQTLREELPGMIATEVAQQLALADDEDDQESKEVEEIELPAASTQDTEPIAEVKTSRFLDWII